MKRKVVTPEEKLVQMIRRRLAIVQVQLAAIRTMPEDDEYYWEKLDGLERDAGTYKQLLDDYARFLTELKCHGGCLPITEQTRLL